VSGDTNLAADVFVHDRLTGTYERVSVSTDGAEGDAFSFGGSISADGRYVSFTSFATNLVAGDTNGVEDVFLHDRAAGTTQRVSVSSAGAQANDFSTLAPVSADGSSVAFVSAASNLVRKDRNGEWDIFVHVT
jgi:Tol biopolymer transport system component